MSIVISSHGKSKTRSKFLLAGSKVTKYSDEIHVVYINSRSTVPDRDGTILWEASLFYCFSAVTDICNLVFRLLSEFFRGSYYTE